jgi:hypothetical protein
MSPARCGVRRRAARFAAGQHGDCGHGQATVSSELSQATGRDRADEPRRFRHAFETDSLPVYAVFPPIRTQPVKITRFVDLLASRLSAAAVVEGPG